MTAVGAAADALLDVIAALVIGQDQTERTLMLAAVSGGGTTQLPPLAHEYGQALTAGAVLIVADMLAQLAAAGTTPRQAITTTRARLAGAGAPPG